METTDWQEISPKSEFYLFLPRDEAALEQYQDFFGVTDIFPLRGVGMTTARDHFVTDMDKERLINRVRLLKHNKGSDEELHTLFNIRRKKGWSIRKAWEMLQGVEDSELPKLVVPVFYRPFDMRWIFYHDSLVWRTAKRVMLHMMRENVGLITSRQVLREFRHAFVADRITNFNSIDTAGRFGSGYLFPLYLYPDTSKKDLFSNLEPDERKPNLNPKIVAALTAAYGEEPAPEAIFHYIYAVLYADAYREKYAEFLKIDFPRIPFTADFELFQTLAALGKRLASLHLLRSEELDPPAARFQGQGDSRVARTKSQGFRYEPQEERVYVNKTQYFEPVPLELWEYQIGGYQVLAKWLKDRRERRLTLEEIKTYCRVVTAIQRTIALQEEIDALYPEAESQIVENG